MFLYFMTARGSFSYFQRKSKVSAINYRPISLLNNYLNFLIHVHVSHCLKFELDPFQHVFTISKSTITNFR
jgi:hypothetical protein